MSFSGNFTVLNGEFPGYFVSAAIGTTDPNFITRASADGLTVIEVTVGDLRDARVYRNQMGEPNILSYGAYIRGKPCYERWLISRYYFYFDRLVEG